MCLEYSITFILIQHTGCPINQRNGLSMCCHMKVLHLLYEITIIKIMVKYSYLKRWVYKIGKGHDLKGSITGSLDQSKHGTKQHTHM